MYSEKFQTRSAAGSELEKVGVVAEKALRQELTKDPPLEVRQRLDKLLERLNQMPASPAWLQRWRGLEALEQIGTAAARETLETLAGNPQELELTQAARASLLRLRLRAGN